MVEVSDGLDPFIIFVPIIAKFPSSHIGSPVVLVINDQSGANRRQQSCASNPQRLSLQQQSRTVALVPTEFHRSTWPPMIFIIPFSSSPLCFEGSQ